MQDKLKQPHEYVNSGEHLPTFLRDFHDQKDLFKTISARYRNEATDPQMPNWTMAQIYTIDWFLWFLGQHGWTLQRSRAKVEFRDIHESVKETMDEMRTAFFAALKAEKNKEQATLE